MTIEDAITQIKDLKSDRESFFSDEANNNDVYHADAEACDIAAECMKRCIPKEPLINWCCPNCEHRIKELQDYCTLCGQRIKWHDSGNIDEWIDTDKTERTDVL